mmetsp:Transcript_8499/g.21210  ORF Transcript_8499/g.21210 Transcript_8499/m.21210 type:complete len:631 (-) Transcript_8499:127-2019(-)
MAHENIDSSMDCTMDRTPSIQADVVRTVSPYQPRKIMSLNDDGDRSAADDMTALTHDLSKSAEFSAAAVSATAAAAVAAVVALSATPVTPQKENAKPRSLCYNQIDRWGNSSSHSSSSGSSLEDDHSDSIATFDDNDDDGSFGDTGSKETSPPVKKGDVPPSLPRQSQLSPSSSASRASFGRRSSDLGPRSHRRNDFPPGFGGDNVPMKPKRRGSEGSNVCSPKTTRTKMSKEKICDINLAEGDGSFDTSTNRSQSGPPAGLHAQDNDRWSTHKRCSRRPSDSTPFSNSTGTRSSSSNSSGLLTPTEIEAYVMARMPPNLKEKLDTQSWNEIFTAAADSFVQSHSQHRMAPHKQQVRSTMLTKEAARIVSRDDDGTDDEESLYSNASDFSDITTPTVFHSPKKKSKPSAVSRTTPTPTPAPESANEDSGPSRSWHEGLSKSIAPRLPIREYSVRERLDDRSSSLPGGISGFDIDIDIDEDVPTPKQSVVFGTVIVREYERILDMNPGTSCGPSVGIGWEYVQLDPVGVMARDNDSRRYRRSASELVLSREEREDILLDLGYSSRDIAHSVRHILKRRNQRKQTIHNLSKQNLEEMVERSSRKVRKVLFGFKSSKPSRTYSASGTSRAMAR